MLDDSVVEAFNNKVASGFNQKGLTPAQQDKIKALGSAAENLLTNRDFVLFIRQFQLETTDAFVDIQTHTADDNARRIALSNQLAGIDSFINLLKRQVVLKNRVVTQQTAPQQSEEPLV